MGCWACCISGSAAGAVSSEVSGGGADGCDCSVSLADEQPDQAFAARALRFGPQGRFCMRPLLNHPLAEGLGPATLAE